MDRTPRRIAVVVALGLTAMAISVPVAQGGIRPDDRAVRGVSAVAVEGTADLNTPATRPDDRSVRGVSVVAVEGTADLNTPATRPDDRAVRGVSAVAVEGTADLNTPATRPDDRSVRGVSVVAVEGTADLNTPATRPDDRSVRGVSVVAVEGTADLNTPATRPDDRAVRGVVALDGSDGIAVGGANVVASAPRVALVSDEGFAWTEAALGASTMLVLLCVLAGAGLLIARQRKPALR